MLTLKEHAIRNYPIGTEFICINTSQKGVITTGLFETDLSDDRVNEIDEKGESIKTNFVFNCIYSQGIWARILNCPSLIDYQIY